MADKLQTAFRLHLETVARMDKLVENPPAWLSGCAPGPVENRTDVLERLVFLAEKHTFFGLAGVAQRQADKVETAANQPATATKSKKSKKQ